MTSASSDQTPFRSGFVALVGRPNAGKSTLTNALCGQKVAITSDTPQTTRHRLRAIVDRPDLQLIIVDTPGIHKPHDALGDELNTSALKALEDVDVACLLIDATKPVGTGDVWVAEQLRRLHCRKVLVITKVDISDPAQVAAQLEAARALADFDDEIVVSAVEGFNVEGFIACVGRYMPEGPRWFPEGMGTDQPLEVVVAEFIREKILLKTRDEVPHSVGVQVATMTQDARKDLVRIYADIYVERDSQKGIVIGRGGSLLKEVGTEARADLERLLGSKVYLDLNVKVKKDWRRDATQVRRFGYGEGL